MKADCIKGRRIGGLGGHALNRHRDLAFTPISVSV